MGLGWFVIGSRACWLAVQLVIGDFSIIIPYGVRVKGFPCDHVGLRVARNSGLGLRVNRGSGLGLRIRSPDDHVILLIPLYLTWGVLDVFFPLILSSHSHYWPLNHPPTLTTQNDYPLCTICWWYDGQTSYPQPTPPFGRFLAFWLIWQVKLIGPF